jgi:anti-sigma factor RsiW
MNCAQWERSISDYIEDGLGEPDRAALETHLASCAPCRELEESLREILAWGAGFPVHEAPSWLAARIVARTPAVVRERWRDTFLGAWLWLAQPRGAMTVFTAVLVLGWTLDVTGQDLSRVVRDPASAYYAAEGIAYRAWDEAVRTFYGSAIITEIYCRIEQWREIAS